MFGHYRRSRKRRGVVSGLVAATCMATMFVGAMVVEAGPAGAVTCTTQTAWNNGYVWYASSTRSYNPAGWCLRRTFTSYSITLYFNSAGDLTLYHSGDSATWTSGTSGRGEKLYFTNKGLVQVNGCTGQGGVGCNPPADLWSNRNQVSVYPTGASKFLLQIGEQGDGAPCFSEAPWLKQLDGAYGWSPGYYTNGPQNCYEDEYATD